MGCPQSHRFVDDLLAAELEPVVRRRDLIDRRHRIALTHQVLRCHVVSDSDRRDVQHRGHASGSSTPQQQAEVIRELTVFLSGAVHERCTHAKDDRIHAMRQPLK